MISFVILTRNRPHALLRRVRDLCAWIARSNTAAELIVLDNASFERPIIDNDTTLGVPFKHIALDQNFGQRARLCVPTIADAASDWFVMLDDDTTLATPRETDLEAVLNEWSPHTGQQVGSRVGIVAADIYNRYQGAPPVRAGGGLPEVARSASFAIRREALLACDKLTPGLRGFAAELDLAANILRAGYSTVFDPRLITIRRVRDRRRDAQRVGRWLMDRLHVVHIYAPEHERVDAMRLMLRAALRRAGRWISEQDFEQWLRVLNTRLATKKRSPLTQSQWDRLIGVAAAREALLPHTTTGCTRFALIEESDDTPLITRVVHELGATLVTHSDHPDALLLATLEPGKLIDAMFTQTHGRREGSPPVIAPWMPPVPNAIEQHTLRAA
ncbi:MAG: hypothetical protein U0640_05380 [Phycisphaerales bacterium]